MNEESILRISMGLVLLVIISEIVIYQPYFEPSPKFKIEDYKINSSRLTINYKISGGTYPTSISVIFLTSQEKPDDGRIVYIYYDSEYQMAIVDKKAVNGIINHLVTELIVRNHPSNKIKVVNATELQHIVLDVKSANKSIIVIPTGAFPDTVYTREKNLIKHWIERGGILIWMTSQFGYYSARNISEPLDFRDPWHPGQEGQKYFFNDNVIVLNKRFKEATIPTQYAKILKLSYNYVYRGVSISAIQTLNGVPVGYVDNDSGAVSIAIIPYSHGKIIIFGGDIVGGPQSLKFVRILTYDIAQILVSGILDGDIITHKEYHLKSRDTIRDDVTILKNMTKLSNGTLIIYAFESESEGTYFEKIALPFNFKDWR